MISFSPLFVKYQSMYSSICSLVWFLQSHSSIEYVNSTPGILKIYFVNSVITTRTIYKKSDLSIRQITLFWTMCSALAERDVHFVCVVCFASDMRFARERRRNASHHCDYKEQHHFCRLRQIHHLHHRCKHHFL